MSRTSFRMSFLRSVPRDQGLEPLGQRYTRLLAGALCPVPDPSHHRLAGVHGLTPMLPHRPHLDVERLRDVDPEVRAVRLEQVDLADRMRREAFSVHLVASGDDGGQRCEADGAVVRVDAVAGPGVVGHEHVRPETPDEARQFAAQGERLLQLAVLMTEESEPGNAQDLGRCPLLRLPYLPQALWRHLWVGAAPVPAGAKHRSEPPNPR